jgi:hypothetical protein
MTRKTLVMLFPAGLLTDSAPIFAAFGGVHAVTVEAGDEHAESFHFGHTPLSGPIPAFLLCFCILLGAADALNLSGDECPQGLSREQGRGNRHDGDENRGFPELFPFLRSIQKPKEEKPGGDVQAHDRAVIEALDNTHADAESGENNMENIAILRGE